jgi:hypothetical protein
MLHELAVGIAATGRRVEVRGEFDFAELEALSDAAGAAPERPLEPLRPGPGDVVLMPEGFDDPLTFGRVALSSARRILLLLAPTGLFGWPFVEGWSRPSPTETAIEELSRPEHFHAMAAMGFELWTNAPQLAAQIEALGLSATLIGNGRPLPFPDPLPKCYDVVTLSHNRWAELARFVVSRLDRSVIHHEIPAAPNDEVLRQFGQARVLVHPMRIEGVSRIAQEARAMGAVPVVLDSNRFAVGLNEAGGAISVATLEEMPTAITSLLSDRQRLGELSERAIRGARDFWDWDRYVAQLDQIFSSPAEADPSGEARAVIADAMIGRERRIRAELTDALARERAVADGLSRELESARDTIRVMASTRAWRLATSYWRARDRFKRGSTQQELSDPGTIRASNGGSEAEEASR